MDQLADQSDGDVASRLARLESAVKSSTESTEGAKAKVRALALQTQPNEALILLNLDHLARVARKQGHHDAEMFDELARQASHHQGRIDMANLVLSVLGGRASDAISKALAKCMKEKPEEQKQPMQGVVGMTSPLHNLYQPPLQPAMSPYGPQPIVQVQPHGFWPRRYGRSNHMGNSNNTSRYRQRGACLFCDSTSHLVRDCEAMKQAKKK